MNKKELKLIIFSGLVVVVSIIIAMLTKPITNIIFGTMGLDNFIVVTYCMVLYYRKLDRGKIIFSTNIVHSFLTFYTRSSIFNSFSIITAQLFCICSFIIIINLFNIKEIPFKRLNLIILSSIATLASAIFAIISYYFFGLPYFIYLFSVIASPLSGVMTVFIVSNLITIYKIHMTRQYNRFINILNKI